MEVDEALRRVLAWLVRESRRLGGAQWISIETPAVLAKNAGILGPNGDVLDSLTLQAIQVGERGTNPPQIQRRVNPNWPSTAWVDFNVTPAGLPVAAAEIARQDQAANRGTLGFRP